jgi:hypothetical protein
MIVLSLKIVKMKQFTKSIPILTSRFFLLIFLFFVSILEGWSQNKVIQIKSDTLLIDSVPKAKIMLKFVQGNSLNFNVDTYFFDPEFGESLKTYRKDYERQVLKELNRRISIRYFVSEFRYGDTSILNQATSSIGFTNYIQDSIQGPNRLPQKTPGQHLARAGRSFNTALALGIGLGVLTPLLATTLGATRTLVFGGIGGAVMLVLYIDGNSSLIRAGEGLDRKIEKP